MPLEQMDFPASYEALRPVVEHEYYDHRAVPQLEEYLDEQVSVGGVPCRVVGVVAREGRGFCHR